MSPAKLLLGVAALLAANYALTELMDDSGLSVVVVRGALPAAPADPTAEASFRARAAATAAELLAADGSVVRLDVARAKAAAAGPPAFELMLVSRSAGEAAAELPAALAAASGELALAGSPLRLRTVFPERSRWRTAVPPPPKPEDPPIVGEIDLLVQQATLTVRPDAADAFKRAWADLGHNAYGEAGVVRCDLLHHAEQPHVFVGRKVFRGADALAAHEASPHYLRWREATSALLDAAGPAATLLDAVVPDASPFPLRTRWSTPY